MSALPTELLQQLYYLNQVLMSGKICCSSVVHMKKLHGICYMDPVQTGLGAVMSVLIHLLLFVGIRDWRRSGDQGWHRPPQN